MRRELLAIVLGVLVGGAAVTFGGDDAELRASLERLRTVTAQLLEAEAAATGGAPPEGGSTGLELGLLPTADLTTARGDRGLLPIGTIDEVMERVRCRVDPAAWEAPASLGRTGDILVALQRADVLKECARELEDARDRAHRCVAVEVQVVDVAHDLAARLAGEAAGPRLLDDVAALGRVFRGRVTVFAGVRAVLRCGAEEAYVAELTRPAAGEARADPKVCSAPAGGTIGVLAEIGDDPGRIALDVDARFDEIGGFAAEDGIELPRSTSARAATNLTVEGGAWNLVGGGTVVGDRTRLLFVRAVVLPRKAGG